MGLAAPSARAPRLTRLRSGGPNVEGGGRLMGSATSSARDPTSRHGLLGLQPCPYGVPVISLPSEVGVDCTLKLSAHASRPL